MNKRFYTVILCSLFFLNFSYSQTVSISGKVLRHNGDPVDGVTVSCSNAPVEITDSEGNFTFTDLPEGENYMIEGFYETDPYENITILDILYIRDYILFVNSFASEFQNYSADFNLSGSVTTFDMVLLTRAAIRIQTDFPDLYWRFLDGAGTIPNITNGISLQNVTEDVENLELVALKSGDVTIDSDHFPPPADSPMPVYYFADTNVALGEEFTVDVLVDDCQRIVGFQQALNWDPSIMEFIEFSNEIDFMYDTNENFVAEGDLIVLGGEYTGDSGVSLDDGSVLYSVKFKALQEINSLTGAIDFSEEIIQGQTVHRGLDNTLYLLEEAFNGVVTSVENIEGLETFAISPNPAQDELFIEVDFEQTVDATLTMFDLSGRLMRSWAINNNTFKKSVSLQGLSKGTYFLKLRTNSGLITKRLIIL